MKIKVIKKKMGLSTLLSSKNVIVSLFVRSELILSSPPLSSIDFRVGESQRKMQGASKGLWGKVEGEYPLGLYRGIERAGDLSRRLLQGGLAFKGGGTE